MALCRSSLQSQNPAENVAPTYKSKVQVVLLDVVVSDANEQPIQGLPKDSFEIFEEGKRQTIASFEEHHGGSPAKLAELPSQPPHFFTNTPTVEPPGSINVLLLDALNTEFGDQANVRLQMIKYLQTIDPGPQLAIFALGSRLRMVQGFTDDPNLLIEALKHKKWGGTPETSQMLRTQAEDNMDTNMLERMREAKGVNPAAIEALARFQAEMAAAEQVSRMSATLDALQELSRYLSGFHGRKNIIWFSGSFPQIQLPSGNEQTQLMEDNGLSTAIKKAINMLAAAQIAVYPVAAQGLDTQNLYQAQNVSHPRGSGVAPGERVIAGQNESLTNENVNRYFNNKAADDIASSTGGQAFYNSNGLKEALADVVHKGAYYYRLSYYPSDKRMLGRYRHITVKVKKGPYATPHSVAYRHGYYEENAKQLNPASTELPMDMLHPLMMRGIPDATELTYRIRLLPAAVQPSPGAPRAGDNKELHGQAVRISADFIIPVDNLELEIAPDGVRHGEIELALVAYDRAGRPLNWITRSIRASLKPEIYLAVQKTGVQFHLEIDAPDVPNDETYIRSGVYDLHSNKAGTIEVQLSKIKGGNGSNSNVAIGQQPAPVIGLASTDAEMQQAQETSPSDSRQITASVTTPQPSSGKLPGPAYSEVPPSEIPAYCSQLAGSEAHSPALAKVCEFALSVRKALPNVICDEKVKRHWSDIDMQRYGRGGAGISLMDHADLVTSKLAYKNGQEFYGDMRVNGTPVESGRPPGGDWSQGEFAAVLYGIFTPQSKTQFRFKKTDKLGSRQALVFEFDVTKENNESYFLRSGSHIWYPAYSGLIWIDRDTAQIARVKRETPYMTDFPITRATTKIDYANVALGDATTLVLPTGSETFSCAAQPGMSDVCAHNVITFSNWHKFRATTTIVFNPVN